MGLRMWIKKVRKLTEAEALPLYEKSFDELCEKYGCVLKEDFDSDPDRRAELIPYLTEIPAECIIFQQAKCFQDHGVAIDDVLIGRSYTSNGSATWIFASGKTISLTREEYESYNTAQIELVYVWAEEVLALWSKWHDLHEHIQEARFDMLTLEYAKEHGAPPSDETVGSWTIENDGYYPLSAAEKQIIKEYLEQHKAEDDTDNSYDFLDDAASVVMYNPEW